MFLTWLPLALLVSAGGTEDLGSILADGDAAMAAGNLRVALGIYREALRMAPGDGRASMGAAQACEGLGDWPCVLENLRTVSDLQPGDSDLKLRIKEIQTRISPVPTTEDSVKPHHGRSLGRAALLGLIPGAGQYYNGQKTKGQIFILGGGILLTGTLVSFIKAENARSLYRKAGSLENFEVLAEAFEGRKRTNRFYFFSFLGATGLSTLDSYFTARFSRGRIAFVPFPDGGRGEYCLAF